MPKPRGKTRWINYISNLRRGEINFPEWLEITGIPVRIFGQYEVTLSGVKFRGYVDAEIVNARREDQPLMIRTNQISPLRFPCSPTELVNFVEGPAGQIGGKTFNLPVGFRDAVALLAPKPDEDVKVFAASGSGQIENAQDVDDWITKAVRIAQDIGTARWNTGVRQVTARNICEAVATELAKDQSTWGKQGQRSSSNVRGEGLRGWKFEPPHA